MLSSEGAEAGNVPAFLNKLWKLVEDPETNELICWSQEGKSFIIKNPTLFTHAILPIFFKHRNIASFIRQLNMYGFRKVQSLESGGLLSENGEMEFAHPKFIKGRKDFISNIKRKVQTPKMIVSADRSNVNDLSDVLTEINSLRKNQDMVGEQLLSLKKDNQLLWRENALIRQRFQKQQQIIEKLVHFLLTMVKPPSQQLGPKRKFSQLALEAAEMSEASGSTSKGNLLMENNPIEFGTNSMSTNTGPIILEVNSSNPDNPVVLEKILKPSAISNNDDLTNENSSYLGMTNRGASYSLHIPSTNTKLKVVKNSTAARKTGGESGAPETTFQSLFNSPEQRQDILQGDQDIIGTGVEQSYNFDPKQKYTITSKNGVFTLEPVATSNKEAKTPSNQSILSQHLSPHNIEPSMVQSPNGTIMDNNLEEGINPDIFQVVNMADVNPNIFVPTMEQPTMTVPTVTNDMGQSTGFKSVNKNGIRTKGGGKKGSKSMKQTISSKEANTQNFDQGISTDFDQSGSEVAIPNKSMGSEDVGKFVDDFESYLNNLQEKFKSGKMGNIDSSVLLSIFGNEGLSNSLNETDFTLPGTGGEISGDELQVYNPDFSLNLDDQGVLTSGGGGSEEFSLDDFVQDDEDIQDTPNFGAGGMSPPKKFKLDFKQQNSANKNDPLSDVLNTPKIEYDPTF